MGPTSKRPSGSLTTFLRNLERTLPKQDRVETPCQGCTACCRDPHMLITVSDEEAKRYRTHRTAAGVRELQRKDNGECVYLIDNRCTTYHDRPRACRVYDCRFHMLGAPISTAELVKREGLANWEPFRLPTTEDKVAFAAVIMLVMSRVKRDPDLTGLAYILLQWKQLREQAYQVVSEGRQAYLDGVDQTKPSLDMLDAVFEAGHSAV